MYMSMYIVHAQYATSSCSMVLVRASRQCSRIFCSLSNRIMSREETPRCSVTLPEAVGGSGLKQLIN